MVLPTVIRELAVLLLLVAALAKPAIAQDQFEGLDLTSEEPKKEEPKQEAQEPQAPPVAPTVPRVAQPTPQRPKELELERDITQEDRVKSVQRKLYLKRGRVELAPYFVVNLNDPFYTRLGGAVRLAYYPHDTLAIAARVSLLATMKTEDVRTAKRNLFSQIYHSVPSWFGLVDLEWSPIYGKVAIFNSILHFDGYLVGGAGLVATETSADEDRAGYRPAFDLGLGLRFVTTDWLAVNVALINTNYVDVPASTLKSSTQNMMLFHVGLSMFFPFQSTYREAE